jgi:hypothetical protein
MQRMGSVPTTDAATDQPATERENRRDVLVVLAGLVFVAAAFVVGALLLRAGAPLHVPTPPLLAWLRPHLGLTSPLAAATAVAAVAYGPRLAQTMSWRALLPAAWLTSLTWITTLCLVDGWDTFSRRLTTWSEYLSEVPDAPAWRNLLAGFAERIVAGSPDSWHTHVAGHPPGAFAFFLLLDRIGLQGGAWAAAICVLFGSTVVVAVAIALRAVDSEQAARRALPFLVLTPAAIWIGVSGDAVFLAVSAWGIALLAVACNGTGRARDVAAVGAGLLFGLTLYLSYGLVLIGMLALAVLIARRRIRPAVIALGALAAVVALVTAGGFWWLEGYQQLSIRYHQGVGGERLYSYWVWANLASLLVCTGLAVLAGIRRIAAAGWKASTGTSLLVQAAVAAVITATLSGFSKAEVERIWLPFAIWLLPACAFLPRRTHRWWLAVQALAALLVQHVLATNW